MEKVILYPDEISKNGAIPDLLSSFKFGKVPDLIRQIGGRWIHKLKIVLSKGPMDYCKHRSFRLLV